MFCMNCGKEVPEGAKFCMNCGADMAMVPKSEAKDANEAMQNNAPAETSSPELQAQPAPEPQPTPAPQPAPQPTPQPQAVAVQDGAKKEKKKGKTNILVIIGIIAAVLVVGIILAVVLGGGKQLNDADAAPVTTTAVNGYNVFSSEDLDLSFLYPSSAQIRDNGSKGVYVYTGGNQGVPYIQVETEGKVSTDSYFKKYAKSLSSQYEDAAIGDIKEVKNVNKTLYMQRANVFTDGADQVIDRYIEQYKNKTIIYTVKSFSEGSEEMALKAIVESLRPSAKAYSALVSASSGGWGQDTTSGGNDDSTYGDDGGSTDSTGDVYGPTTPSDGGGSTGEDTGSEEEDTGGLGDFGDVDDDVQMYGSGDYKEYYSSDYTWGFMSDASIIDNSGTENNGIRLYPKGKTAKEASIFVSKNSFQDQGVSTAQDFIDSYSEQLKQNGTSQTQPLSFQGGNFNFTGVLAPYMNGSTQCGIIVWACNDSNGNIYAVYYECSENDLTLYNEIASGIMYSLTVLK